MTPRVCSRRSCLGDELPASGCRSRPQSGRKWPDEDEVRAKCDGHATGFTFESAVGTRLPQAGYPCGDAPPEIVAEEVLPESDVPHPHEHLNGEEHRECAVDEHPTHPRLPDLAGASGASSARGGT